MAKPLLKQIRYKALNAAWRAVRANGLRSSSATTRASIRRFDEAAHTHLSRIERQIRRGTFRFKPQRGIPLPKPSGGHRPLIVAEIEDRIVQRAILDLLTKHPSIQKILSRPTIFGGIPDRDRVDAFRAVHCAVAGGAQYYIRSDIRDFFTHLPRDKAVCLIRELTGEPDFADFFGDAISVNLENIDTLGHLADLFPLEDGVAQGSPLSPLLANIVLKEFDEELNSRQIVCLRYIDDFLILAPGEKHARKAFQRAQQLLQEVHPSLAAYSPEDQSKAEAGYLLQDGKPSSLDFLGCTLRIATDRNHPSGYSLSVQPNKKARQRLQEKLRLRVNETLANLQGFSRGAPRHTEVALAQGLKVIDDLLRGWAGSIKFCTNRDLRRRLDRRTWAQVQPLLKILRIRLPRDVDYRVHMRSLGVFLLEDADVTPIE